MVHSSFLGLVGRADRIDRLFEMLLEEARQRRGQSHGNHRYVIVTQAYGDDRHHCGGHQSHGRSQPVHAVEQVQGVDATDQPGNRQGNCKPTQLDRIIEGNDAIDAVAQRDDGQHGAYLQQKLYLGT